MHTGKTSEVQGWGGKLLASTGRKRIQNKQRKTKSYPSQCGLVEASSHKPKCRRFDSQSGHMPGLQVCFPFRVCVRDSQSMLLSHITISLPLSLPPFPLSKIIKHVLGWGLKEKKTSLLEGLSGESKLWVLVISLSADPVHGQCPAVSQHWPHPWGSAMGTFLLGRGSITLMMTREKWRPPGKGLLNPCTQTYENYRCRLGEALVPKEWVTGSQKNAAWWLFS